MGDGRVDEGRPVSAKARWGRPLDSSSLPPPVKKLIDIFFAIPPVWCVVAVFALTGAESALLVGFLVPGEVAAILGGVIASHGRVPLAAMMAAAVAGAWCGDSIGYAMGRRTGASFFGKKRKKEWGRARKFLRRGGVAVLLGRFTPFVRTIMPAAAGAARMPYRRFLPWNLPGGLIWGVFSTAIGYWGGRNAEKVVHRVGIGSLVILAAVAAGIAFLYVRFRRGHPRRRRGSRTRV